MLDLNGVTAPCACGKTFDKADFAAFGVAAVLVQGKSEAEIEALCDRLEAFRREAFRREASGAGAVSRLGPE